MDILHRCFTWLFPLRCVSCGLPANHDTRKLCNTCHGDLNKFTYQNTHNLLRRPDIKRHLYKPNYHMLIAAAPYQPPVSQWVQGLKFHQQIYYARLLAEVFIDVLIARDDWESADCIMPIPLHQQRLRERGFNQATEIATYLQRALSIPLDVKSLTRPMTTQAQSALDLQERRKNIRNAFTYDGPVYSHVILFDDVITTGATIREATRILKKAGIKRVSVWTICATLKQ